MLTLYGFWLLLLRHNCLVALKFSYYIQHLLLLMLLPRSWTTKNIRRSSWILVWKLVRFDRLILLVPCNPTDFYIDRITTSAESDGFRIGFKYYQSRLDRVYILSSLTQAWLDIVIYKSSFLISICNVYTLQYNENMNHDGIYDHVTSVWSGGSGWWKLDGWTATWIVWVGLTKEEGEDEDGKERVDC